MENYQKIEKLVEETEIFLEMGMKENDYTAMGDIKENLKLIDKNLKELELVTYFKGKYDSSCAILTITSGAGGTDAQDWALMLLRMYQHWIERKKWNASLIDISYGEEAGIKSATLIADGSYAYGNLKSEIGIHRLVRLSPFNASHKRQTSFAAVDVIPELDETPEIEIK